MRDGYAITSGAARRRESLLLPARVCALVLVAVVSAGCGGKPRPVPTSGRVTIDGVPVGAVETAPLPARISFIPKKGGEGPSEGPTLRAATASLDSDGRYELSSFKPGDGVLPGEYDVVIISLLSIPTMMNPSAPEVSEIPKHYGVPGQSGLSVTVPDQRAPLTFDFPLKR